MKFENKLMKMKGHVSITEIDATTGQPLSAPEGHNVIVKIGMDQLLTAFTQPLASGSQTNHTVRTLKIGDDIGNGTPSNPEEPDWDYDGTEQNVIFTVGDGGTGSLTFSSVSDQQVDIRASVVGSEVLQSAPGETQVVYYSAGLYTGDGSLIAFRRFSERFITNNINLDIRWTIGFTDCESLVEEPEEPEEPEGFQFDVTNFIVNDDFDFPNVTESDLENSFSLSVDGDDVILTVDLEPVIGTDTVFMVRMLVADSSDSPPTTIDEHIRNYATFVSHTVSLTDLQAAGETNLVVELRNKADAGR